MTDTSGASINKAFKKMYLFCVPQFPPLGEIELPTNEKKTCYSYYWYYFCYSHIENKADHVFVCIYMNDFMRHYGIIDLMSRHKRLADPGPFLTLK